MKKSTKAILASAFVFPGIGHILLKRYSLAAILITIASAATLIILRHIVSQAMLITEKIMAGEIQPDFLLIRRLLKEQQSIGDTQMVDIAILALIGVWIISIIDAYRIGKQHPTEQ